MKTLLFIILIIIALLIYFLIWLIRLPFKIMKKRKEKQEALRRDEERRRRKEEEERRQEEERERERRKEERERKRKRTPCFFVDGFSKSDFKQMAYRVAKGIKRLKVEVIGPVVYGTVQSQSGISEWHFRADYNNYGHITGTYWLSKDNFDSSIPENYAERLAREIRNFVS